MCFSLIHFYHRTFHVMVHTIWYCIRNPFLSSASVHLYQTADIPPASMPNCLTSQWTWCNGIQLRIEANVIHAKQPLWSVVLCVKIRTELGWKILERSKHHQTLRSAWLFNVWPIPIFSKFQRRVRLAHALQQLQRSSPRSASADAAAESHRIGPATPTEANHLGAGL